jgi:hypothetical protein
MLATSDNDNEALSAFRTASSLLREGGMTWSAFVSVVDKSMTHSQTRVPSIKQMLEYCLVNNQWQNTREFIGSMRNFYAKRGYLSEKQMAALEKTYNMTKQKMGEK